LSFSRYVEPKTHLQVSKRCGIEPWGPEKDINFIGAGLSLKLSIIVFDKGAGLSLESIKQKKMKAGFWFLIIIALPGFGKFFMANFLFDKKRE